jgi:hypothetical protein
MAQQKAEADRMQEVTLLLVNLFDREQTTLKAIFGCLYDIGAVNFINQKIRPQPLRSLIKPIARLTKPVFIFMGYRWFQKKCPPLITRWLQRKVQFPAKVKPPQPSPQQPASITTTPPTVTEYVIEYQIEIRRLRSRLRLTRVALAGVSVTTLVLVLIQVNLKPGEPFWQSTVTQQTNLLQSRPPIK